MDSLASDGLANFNLTEIIILCLVFTFVLILMTQACHLITSFEW